MAATIMRAPPEPPSTITPDSRRLLHLDNLKTVFVAGVILAHATTYYIGGGAWVNDEGLAGKGLIVLFGLIGLVGSLFWIGLFFLIRPHEVVEPGAHLESVGEEVTVGQHGQLGRLGRSARGLEKGQIVAGNLHGWGANRRDREQRLQAVDVFVLRQAHPVPIFPLLGEGEEHAEEGRKILLDGGDDDMLQRGQLSPHRVYPGIEGRETHHGAHLGVAPGTPQLCLRAQGTGGNHDSTGSPAAKDGDDHLRAVGQQQRDPVARPDTEPLQCIGEAVDGRIQLAVRQHAAKEMDGWTIRIPLRIDGQEVGKGQVENLNGVRNTRLIPVQPRFIP